MHRREPLQFRCDEKGFLAICAFGLPGRSHEDGPARGIQAAIDIIEAIRVRRSLSSACHVCKEDTLGLALVRASVYLVEEGSADRVNAACCMLAPSLQRRGGSACCGVTTGQLFCAMVGSQRRSEYTVFGEQGE